MMPNPELFRRWWTVVLDHVLDPVITIGSKIRNPVGAIVTIAALPKKPKTQNVFIEFVLLRRILYVHSDMQHMVGNAPVREAFAAIFRLKGTFEILHELDVVSLRVLDDEAVVTV